MGHKKKIVILVVICSLTFLTACGQQEYSIDKELEQSFTSGLIDSLRDIFGMGDKGSYQAEDVDPNFVQRQTDFSFALYKQIIEEEGHNQNLFISPLSIALALALTYNGAEGETKAAMEQVLKLQGLTVEDTNQAFQILKDVLEYADPDVDLNINESLWIQQGREVSETFLQNMEKYYGAEVTELDFSKEESRERINNWVSDRTNGKIEGIADHLDPKTVMALVNTIYFLGAWTNPFVEAQTVERDFHLQDGTTKKHPLMTGSGIYQYYEDELLQSVRLPYGDERFSMYMFLPQEELELEDLVNELFSYSSEEWNMLLESYHQEDIELAVPRFELEYGIQLNDVLKNMGMEIAFGTEADFSNMLEGGGVWIDEVVHKAYIRTDEKGTEAAGATIVTMAESARMDPPAMTVDRPFLFLIKEELTNTIFFLGSIVNPEDVKK